MDEEFLEKIHKSAHGMWKMIVDFEGEELESLMALIIACDPKNESTSANYYRGIIDGVKLIKESFCPTCKIIHDLDDGEYMKDMYAKMSGGTRKQSVDGTYL